MQSFVCIELKRKLYKIIPTGIFLISYLPGRCAGIGKLCELAYRVDRNHKSTLNLNYTDGSNHLITRFTAVSIGAKYQPGTRLQKDCAGRFSTNKFIGVDKPTNYNRSATRGGTKCDQSD